MEGICDLLDPRCILLDLNEAHMDSIIDQLSKLLTQAHPSIAEKTLMEKAKQQGYHTTCLGFGCAITHTRCPSMQKTLMAAARLSPAQNFKAPDGEPVTLVFLLVGPQSSASFHLKVLSRLARLLHDASLRKELQVIKDPSAFHTLICNKEQ